MSSKVNRIELDKNQGLTIQVTFGEQTQTIRLDGTQVTIEVKAGDKVSTIVQTATGVTIKADSFKVDSSDVSINGSSGVKVTCAPLNSPVPVGALELTAIPSPPALSTATLSGLMVDMQSKMGTRIEGTGPLGVTVTGTTLKFLGAPIFLPLP
jgi:hypothetical protein